MTARPHIAVVKPDFGINGGFERHLDDLIAGLRERHWRIDIVTIDGTTKPRRLYGLPVEPVQLELHNEFFVYLALVEQTQQLQLDHFDAVLTTQPPTYLVPHQAKVALFFHQARLFYDLSEPVAASGIVDPEIHGRASEAVRRLEGEAVGDVRFWLAGSAESAARLKHHWSIPDEAIDTYSAPPTSTPQATTPLRPDGPIVSVSRLEWPKRVELLVQAMHLTTSERAAHLVGGGSRLDFVKDLDSTYHRDPQQATSSFDPLLWVDKGVVAKGPKRPPEPPSGRIVFEGPAGNERRDQLYDEASVVVAPAYREDYGLTAIEAMIRARPVIVCRDGGGLTEMIDDGVNGLIVDPDARALARAIDHLVTNPETAAKMGRAARESVQHITLEAAVTQVEQALRRALDLDS